MPEPASGDDGSKRVEGRPTNDEESGTVQRTSPICDTNNSRLSLTMQYKLLESNQVIDDLGRIFEKLEGHSPRFVGLAFHQDSFGRVRDFKIGNRTDQYISPKNRKLKNLVVQCSDLGVSTKSKSTWQRGMIRNASPLALRLAAWATSDGPIAVISKRIPASLGLFCLIFFPIKTGPDRYHGRYPPVYYQFNGYPKAAANEKEEYTCPDASRGDVDGGEMTPEVAQFERKPARTMERVLHPPVLEFLLEDRGKTVLKTPQEWLNEDPSRDLQYIFVAYTADHFNTSNDDDAFSLNAIAWHASKKARVPAFYCTDTCLGMSPFESSSSRDRNYSKQTAEDVWKLNDIVRGAQAVVIALKQPPNKTLPVDDLLVQMAERVWTLPELLLAPAKKEVAVYVDPDSFNNGGEPFCFMKNQIAARAWRGEKAALVRQLIDHYEGNLHLSRLQLPALALECLFSSKIIQHFPGDHAYALSGLLSIRPVVDETDSAFQAFARLSLANDSDRLLERLICLLPKSVPQAWHKMDDAWDVRLWDVQPRCQVSAIGHDDTVILDNAIGAAIRWKSFVPVAQYTMPTFARRLMRGLLRLTVSLWVLGAALMIFAIIDINLAGANPVFAAIEIVGIVLFSLAVLVILFLPEIVKKLWGGKVYNSHAWLFGFEGYMPLPEIEKRIWAEPKTSKLKRSPFSSVLSRHKRNKFYQCEGIGPDSIGEVEELADQAASRGEKLFTLVDTTTMTVTLFTAARPPVALIVCGSEGGMQRVALASYDWRTQTLHRETILRLPTIVVDRMNRIGRFRFALSRKADTEPRVASG